MDASSKTPSAIKAALLWVAASSSEASYHIRWRCLRQSCLIKQGCHINNNVMCILVKARDFTQLCSLSLYKIQREGFGNNVKNLVRKSLPSPANVRKFGENILDPRKVCAFCGHWNKREVFFTKPLSLKFSCWNIISRHLFFQEYVIISSRWVGVKFSKN